MILPVNLYPLFPMVRDSNTAVSALYKNHSKSLIKSVRPYSFTFTAASLRPELMGAVAEIYQKLGSWEKTKEQVLKTNALQCRSLISLNRLEREIRPRLRTLTLPELRRARASSWNFQKRSGIRASASPRHQNPPVFGALSFLSQGSLLARRSRSGRCSAYGNQCRYRPAC